MRIPAKLVRRGAATVELAAVLPLLLFLFVIGVDYGRIFYFSQVLTDSARDGAFYYGGILQPDDPNEKAALHSPYGTHPEAALDEARNLSPQPTISNAVTGTDENGKTYVEVTATWEFHPITHFPGVPISTTLRRTVRMRDTTGLLKK
ncbi:MAG: hypothetical protein C0467_24860 [Planctomycetaceae bacterium]|nr:hypothetical protein [Planctomycetaceae bacterium]